MQEKENEKPISKPKENLNEETQDINAIAKGLMVYLSWSMAGLTTPRKSSESQKDAPQ